MRKFVIVIYFLLDPIIMLVIKINYFLRKMTITFFNQISFFIILVCSIRIILTIIKGSLYFLRHFLFFFLSHHTHMLCYYVIYDLYRHHGI